MRLEATINIISLPKQKDKLAEYDYNRLLHNSFIRSDFVFNFLKPQPIHYLKEGQINIFISYFISRQIYDFNKLVRSLRDKIFNK